MLTVVTLMAIVDLVAICLLGKWAFAALRDFHRQSAQGIDPVFVASEADLPGVLDGDIWDAPQRRQAGALPESLRIDRPAVRSSRTFRAPAAWRAVGADRSGGLAALKVHVPFAGRVHAHCQFWDNHWVMRLLLALTSIAAVIGLAAPARADIDNDQDFLTDLKQAGLSYQDPAQAITAAKSVCDLLDDGKSGAEIVTELRNRNPAFQGAGAAQFTFLAAAHYCPNYITGEGRAPKPEGASGN